MASTSPERVKEEKEKRWPLSFIMFKTNVPIPGSTIMMSQLDMTTRRVVNGKDWLPDGIWYYPSERLVKINDRTYPLENVLCFDRAPAAITKKPPPLDLAKYTQGKRA